MLKNLDILRDFLFVTGKFKYPGFGRVLGLDAQTVLRQQDAFMYDPEMKQLQYRYQVPKQYYSQNNRKKFPLSKFLAIFDEVTTWAIVTSDRKRRAGVSVTLSAEMFSDVIGKELQINAQVVKSGKIMAFTTAEAIDITSGQVICKGRHIKYLPMPWLVELALGPLLPLVKWYAAYFLSSKESLDDRNPVLVEDVVQFNETSPNQQSARFQVEPDHCNPMGALHGGCQAVGMELLGKRYANETASTNNNNNLRELKSMSVTYMSTGRKEILLDANWIHQTEIASSMSVQLLSSSGKPISEGILQFVSQDHSSKKKEE